MNPMALRQYLKNRLKFSWDNKLGTITLLEAQNTRY